MLPHPTLPYRPWLSALAAICLTASGALAEELSPQRQAQLGNLVVQDCGSCHGMTMKGGLGTPLQPQDLAGIEAETIAQIVLDGVPGTPMPPWRGLIDDSEALWIAKALKSGVLK